MSVQTVEHPDGAQLMVSHSFPEFRDALSRAFVPLEVIGSSRGHFSASLQSVWLGDVAVTEVQADRHGVARTPRLISGAKTGYVKASIQLSGSGLLVHGGREVHLRPGNMALYSTDAPYTLTFDGDVRAMVLMFPASALRLPPSLVTDLMGRELSSASSLGRTVFSFLLDLPRRGLESNGLVRPRLARAAIDMIAAMAAADMGTNADLDSPRGRLVSEIGEYIEANLHDPNLGPRQIAEAHYISTRHLHWLFSDQGVTVAGWIRRRRLERCREDLLDAANRDVPVGTLAARVGFSDSSHFSRLFRMTYGCTASEMRSGPALSNLEPSQGLSSGVQAG